MLFNYVRHKEEYLQALEDLALEESLACDSETYALPELKSKGSALDPHTGRISLFIAKGRETKPYVFDFLWLNSWGCDYEGFKELLCRKRYLIFQNGRFDLKFLQSTLGFMPENIHDTLVMAKLFTNATGSKMGRVHGHSYADLCRDFLNVHITGKKEQRESTWYCGLNARNLENDWWLSKLTYAANDVQYLFELHDILYKVLTDPLPDSPLTQTGNTGDSWGFQMQEVLEREFAYTPLLARREYVGLPVSKTALRLMQEAVDKRMYELGAKLSIAFNLDEPKLNWKRVLMPSERAMKTLRSSSALLDLIRGAIRLNKLDNVQSNVLTRIVEILDALSSRPEDEESAVEVFVDEDEELLYGELELIEQSELMELCPLMKDVLEFKRLSKQSGMNLQKFINPVTGRIHANFGQLETATGRIACIASGQRVMVRGGWTKIEDVKEGQYVYCYTEDGWLVQSPVTKFFDNGVKEVVTVYWKKYHPKQPISGELICTPDHSLRVENGEWIQAKDLKGHALFRNGYKVYDVKPTGYAPVYNLEVRTYHNYIVNHLCVKNCSTPNLQQVSNRIEVEVECGSLEEFFNVEPGVLCLKD